MTGRRRLPSARAMPIRRILGEEVASFKYKSTMQYKMIVHLIPLVRGKHLPESSGRANSK